MLWVGNVRLWWTPASWLVSPSFELNEYLSQLCRFQGIETHVRHTTPVPAPSTAPSRHFKRASSDIQLIIDADIPQLSVHGGQIHLHARPASAPVKAYTIWLLPDFTSQPNPFCGRIEELYDAPDCEVLAAQGVVEDIFAIDAHDDLVSHVAVMVVRARV